MEFELFFRYQGEDQKFPLPQGETVIGRKEYCDLCLVDGGVSKRHARLIRRGDQVELHDAGSRNGTLVNGEVVDQVEIHPGDVIQVGTIAITLIEASAASHTSFLVDDDDFNAPDAFDDNKMGQSKNSRASVAGNSGDTFKLLSGEEERIETAKPSGRLTVYDSGNTTVYDCYDDRVVTLGTKEGNTVVLGGDGISRYHAEVYNDGNDWIAKDLGSRNGIFIKPKGAKEPEKHDIYTLETGDEIQIGTCRLRFETVKHSNIDLAQMLKDPKAKPIIAGVVMVLIIALLLIPSSGPGGSGPGGGKFDYKGTLQAGVKFIQEKNYAKATQYFAALQKSYPKQKAPGLFLKLTSKWPDQSNPIVFDWAEAHQWLKEIQTENDTMPKFVRIWVDSEAKRIGLNKKAFNHLREGQKSFEQGDKANRQNRFDSAVELYDDSLQLFSAISPKSAFYDRSKEQVKILRRKLYDLYFKRAETHYTSKSSEWNKAMKNYELAQNYTTENRQLFALKKKMNSCIRNYEDEKKYQRAVEIVQGRDFKQYSTALDLLLSIGKASDIYDDAEAYVYWVRADLKVREATRLYKKGNEKCLELMDEVLRVKILGPEARRGVQTRKQRWNRVITSYNEGRSAFLQGAVGYKNANILLKEVIKEERDRQVYYRNRATKMLDTIRSATRGNDRNLAILGLKALKKEKFADAISYFDQLRRSKTAPTKYLKAIAKVVEKTAKERRWFHKAYWDVLLKRDLNRYQWAHDVFFILKEYLPNSNSAKKEAKKFFEKIDKEIELLGQSLEKAKGD
ncbi:MAG: FHA domain-containing protein [Planctomycetota bacterium]|nr:FHA domain-containing protein [Planctomycetota bacterium]